MIKLLKNQQVFYLILLKLKKNFRVLESKIGGNTQITFVAVREGQEWVSCHAWQVASGYVAAILTGASPPIFSVCES